MNHKQLEALIYVHKHTTFRKAAEALHEDSGGEEFITSETIQYRLKQLEAELGVTLYEKRRGSAHVALTREAHLFLREAIDVYQRMREWPGMFLDSPRGSLTIATTQVVMIHLLQGTIREYRARHSAVSLRLLRATAREMEELVLQGRVDFAISSRPPERDGLEYILWTEGEIVLITPRGHELARRPEVTLRDVVEHPLVLPAAGPQGERELIDEAFLLAEVKRPDVVLEAPDAEVIQSHVEAGLGVSLLSELSLRRCGRNIEQVRIAKPPGRTAAGILVREGQHLYRRVREFLELLSPKVAAWLAEREMEMSFREAGSEPSSKTPNPV